MNQELKKKILDVIYAGDWSFRDKDYNKVAPNFFQFGLDNEDIIVEAIIETMEDESRMRCPRGLTSPDMLCMEKYLCYDECWSVTDGWQKKIPERQGRRRTEG